MLRTALIPAALLAALSFATADTAEAAPLHSSKAFFGPKVFVSGGIGVRVPLRRTTYVRSRRVVRSHAVVAAPSGYWKSIPYSVLIPGHVIGHDRFGNRILSPDRTEIRYRQVWVETAPVVVHRRAHYPRVSTQVGLGLGIRFR